MIAYFLFLALLIALPLGAVLAQVRMAKRLAQGATFPRTLIGLTGTAVLTSAAWLAICFPVGIMFALGCPGATQLPARWVLSGTLFFEVLARPFSGELLAGTFPWLMDTLDPGMTQILVLAQLPIVLTLIGLVAFTLARRGVRLPGPRLSRGHKLILLGSALSALLGITLAGDRLAYPLLVPEASDLPLPPDVSLVSVGKLRGAYTLASLEESERVVHFHTRATSESVYEYYRQAMPQRGWVLEEGPTAFYEGLTFTRADGGGRHDLKIHISERKHGMEASHDVMFDLEVVKLPRAGLGTE